MDYKGGKLDVVAKGYKFLQVFTKGHKHNIKLYIEKRLKNGGNVSGVAIFVKVHFVFNLINAYGQFYIYRT